MQRSFGGTTFEPVQEGRDREITVGPAILTGFVVFLVAICAGCFIAGYAMGHRSPVETGTVPAASSEPSAAQLLRDNQSKPGASQVSVPASTDPGSATAAGATTVPASQGAESAAYQPAASTAASPAVVQTSLPAQAAQSVQAALPAQSAARQVSAVGQTVQPALPQAGQWMVQIAAVSHEEDADVLLSALRKRGYTVSARHDPSDNLLHVQVGPFNNHNDATAMREKLLSDGYNAVIQP